MPRGPAHQVYCRCFLDFAKARLQDFSRSWRLMECLVGIRVDGMRVEVLFYPVERFPRGWEAVELSSIDVCPMYGPFELRCNGPTAAEFFQMLNCIQYVWMPHSNGLYSPLDTTEPSLSDLLLWWNFLMLHVTDVTDVTCVTNVTLVTNVTPCNTRWYKPSVTSFWS